MNLVLGDLGVLVAFVASLFGIITLAAGLFEDRPAVRRSARWPRPPWSDFSSRSGMTPCRACATRG